MSLIRQGVNPFGGDEFVWDATWELGGPIGHWCWGDSVIAQNGLGERRYYNTCDKCHQHFWYPRLLLRPTPTFCNRCQPKGKPE